MAGSSRGTARRTTSCCCPTPTASWTCPTTGCSGSATAGPASAADGVLRVVRSAAHPEAASMAGDAEWFMDYRNADGSAVEMCGNGIRVFARFLVDGGWAEPGDLPVATRDGVKQVRVGPCRRRHRGHGPGPAARDSTGRCGSAATSWPATEVDVGNPHAVVFVDGWPTPGSCASRRPSSRPSRRGQRRVRRGPRPGPRRDAGARARRGGDPVLRHGGVRGDGRRGGARRRG